MITDGIAAGWFSVASARLTPYALLDLGMGISAWYREDGDLSENELAWQYADFAMHLVGAA